MSGLVLRTSIPSADIHIMHAAVVERGAFKLMSLTRRKARGHMTDTYDGQIAYFSRLHEILHLLGVPGISQIEVNGTLSVGVTFHVHHSPFIFSAISQRFLAYHMLAALECSVYSAGSGVCQCEKSYAVDVWIQENIILIGGKLCIRSQFCRRLCSRGIDVTYVSHIPQIIFDKLTDMFTTHSTETNHPNRYSIFLPLHRNIYAKQAEICYRFAICIVKLQTFYQRTKNFMVFLSNIANRDLISEPDEDEDRHFMA